ncbi:hypothetical protein [Streptomyces sp. NBC_01431]|uniref:hypothetical protein n=1 Tax=Streptomyces sp. NBC_01431 TaxID=2903863 RepID=UPI002E372214|nr:hypothetical protein [Streptomyces sp. NBC_01431]
MTWSRGELPPRIAEILDADPAVTIEQVTHALDIAYTTAKQNLAQLRGKRIADRPQTEPELTPHQATAALGYVPAVHKTALELAGVELPACQVQPYLRRRRCSGGSGGGARAGVQTMRRTSVSNRRNGVNSSHALCEGGEGRGELLCLSMSSFNPHLLNVFAPRVAHALRAGFL